MDADLPGGGVAMARHQVVPVLDDEVGAERCDRRCRQLLVPQPGEPSANGDDDDREAEMELVDPAAEDEDPGAEVVTLEAQHVRGPTLPAIRRRRGPSAPA